MLVAADGSLLGLRHSATGAWRLVNSSNVLLRGNEFEMPFSGGGGSGVDDSEFIAVDQRRDVSLNRVIEPCKSAPGFFCKFIDGDTCRRSFTLSSATARGDNGDANTTMAPIYTKLVPISVPKCPDLISVHDHICRNFSDAIDSDDPFCKQTGSNYPKLVASYAAVQPILPPTSRLGTSTRRLHRRFRHIGGRLVSLASLYQVNRGMIRLGQTWSRQRWGSIEALNDFNGGKGGVTLNDGRWGARPGCVMKDISPGPICAPWQPTKAISSGKLTSTVEVEPDRRSSEPEEIWYCCLVLPGGLTKFQPISGSFDLTIFDVVPFLERRHVKGKNFPDAFLSFKLHNL